MVRLNQYLRYEKLQAFVKEKSDYLFSKRRSRSRPAFFKALPDNLMNWPSEWANR
jgi:hypothetical protein